jgi:hypothetical protein
MTPEEEAYEEARRRIREAEETGAVLRGLALDRFPRELERLTSLQALDLSWCQQLSDISLLARITSNPIARPSMIASYQRNAP